MPALTIEEILHARLLATPAVTNIVSAGGVTRIYPVTNPQSLVLPAITYFLVSDELNLTMGINLSFDKPRLQFSCWAKSYGQAKQLAEAVRGALVGYVDFTTNPNVIQVVTTNKGPDLYEPDTQIYHAPVDLTVWTQAV